jgi:dihydroneopterin aldolase
MAGVHPVFHVSQLKKSEKEVEAKQVPMELLDLQDTLEYAEYPEKILDRAVKETRRTTIPFCKVLCSNHTEREATWEKEADLRKEYPHLFAEEVGVQISRTRFSVVGENVTNQKIRCENLEKFKTFCLKLSAINFQPKLLALP